MKIKKNQLVKIIKEELTRHMMEASMSSSGPNRHDDMYTVSIYEEFGRNSCDAFTFINENEALKAYNWIEKMLKASDYELIYRDDMTITYIEIDPGAGGYQRRAITFEQFMRKYSKRFWYEDEDEDDDLYESRRDKRFARMQNKKRNGEKS